MDTVESTPEPRDISHLFIKVVVLQEAINWIAHSNFSGPSFGMRSLFELCETSEGLDAQIHEDWGRENLAFDLLWGRAERGEIRIYGRKAGLEQHGEGDDAQCWGKSANEPEPIPPELLATAAWTEDDGGGIEAEFASYWRLSVHHDDLMRWFPIRGPSGQDKAAVGLRNHMFEAAGHHSPQRGRALASTESKCRRWIGELVAEGVVPRSRDDLFNRALAEFPVGLSRRGFDRCWDQTAPDIWKRAGRRPRQD
jgi:hypothetical protein